jgi:hypothetical protein
MKVLLKRGNADAFTDCLKKTALMPQAVLISMSLSE